MAIKIKGPVYQIVITGSTPEEIVTSLKGAMMRAEMGTLFENNGVVDAKPLELTEKPIDLKKILRETADRLGSRKPVENAIREMGFKTVAEIPESAYKQIAKIMEGLSNDS